MSVFGCDFSKFAWKHKQLIKYAKPLQLFTRVNIVQIIEERILIEVNMMYEITIWAIKLMDVCIYNVKFNTTRANIDECQINITKFSCLPMQNFKIKLNSNTTPLSGAYNPLGS